jgi:hypothetical protein
VTQNEKQLKAVEQEMSRLADEIKSIWSKAEEDERETTSDERGDVETKLKDIETLRAKKADIDAAIAVEKNVKSRGSGRGWRQAGV